MSHSDSLRAYSAELAPIPTAEEMVRWDRSAIEDFRISEHTLIESSGRAAAQVIHSLYPRGTLVAAVGAGHNGADAMVMLRTLAARGRNVIAVPLGGDPSLGDFSRGWQIPVAAPENAETIFRGAGVIVDGLLGTGARGAPRDPYAQLIRKINMASAPVVALDGPSGIDLTDGREEGEAVDADVTIAFGALKRGLCLFPGRLHSGRIIVVEVGFPPFSQPNAAALVTPGWAEANLPRIEPNSHKGSLGTVVAIAGHPGMGGAAIMVGMGALRAGAGAARIVSPAENRVAIQASIPEALFVDRESESLPSVVEAADSMIVGPGMGMDEGAREVLRMVLKESRGPVVLDADALTMISEEPEILPESRRERLLLTPHPGEMSRLLKSPTSEITSDPFGAAAEAARRFGCSVLLKGAPSIVASPGERILVNLTGHSGIATGGMGDTLAGICGAFMAAGTRPREAAALALYFSGRAAEIAGRGRSLLPRDVAEALPRALQGFAAPASSHELADFMLDIPRPR